MSIQLFTYQEMAVRTETDEQGNPWFCAKDVCAALGIKYDSHTLYKIRPEWKGMGKLPTPLGGAQRFRTINEAAIYKLAFRSHKESAEAFTDWVAGEVLPSIRKTGRFASQQQALPLPPPAPEFIYGVRDPLGYFEEADSRRRDVEVWLQGLAALIGALPMYPPTRRVLIDYMRPATGAFQLLSNRVVGLRPQRTRTPAS